MREHILQTVFFLNLKEHVHLKLSLKQQCLGLSYVIK